MPRFIDVVVQAHAALPDGFVGRWKAAGEPAPIDRVWYEPDDGPDGDYGVQAAWQDGRRTPAQQVRIDDSAAGVSLLVLGGDWGLRLQLDGGPEQAEPYLIVAPDD